MAWILWIFNKSDGDTFASCKAQKLWLSIHDAIRGQRADRRRGWKGQYHTISASQTMEAACICKRKGVQEAERKSDKIS